VDGFRIDVLWHLVKAKGLPDNPVNPDYDPAMGEKYAVLQTNSTDQPEVHDIAADFRRLADSYGDRVLVGEVCLPVQRLMAYYGHTEPEVHLPFNFLLLDAPWDAAILAETIAGYEDALPPGAWPNWVLGSHDAPRVAGRLGEAQARVAAMLLLTLRGTPTLYQGDEIGIGEVAIPPDRVRDPRELGEPGLRLGRDPARTPMAWDSSAHGGFSNAEPWLPLHADALTRNVAVQRADPGSLLNLYRAVLGLRRAHPALSIGDIALAPVEGNVLSYARRCGDEHLFVALNLGGEEARFTLPEAFRGGRVLLSTLGEAVPGETLRPNEGVVIEAGG
jgi:glycosidase